MDLLRLKATLALDSTEYEQGLSDASGKARKFGKVSSAVFGAFMEIGRRATASVFNAISTNIGSATKRFDTLNNYPKVMQSLGFSADQAKASMDLLGNSINHLPTTLDKVASQTQQVVAVVGDLDEATELTLALNNAMAAGSAPAEQQASAINQWVQAMAKGKPDLQDWRALVQTAPAQMDQLAKSMLGANANQQDLYQAMQSGKVTIDEVNDAMIDLAKNGGEGFESWEEQAKNAGAGIQMAMVNIKAAIQRNIANILDAFDKLLKGGDEAADGIAKRMESIIPSINKVGDTISSMLSGDISFEGGMTSLLNSMGDGLRDAVTTGGDFITNLMEGMASAAPGLVETAQRWVGRISTAISSTLPSVIESGANLIGGLVQGFSEGLPRVVDGLVSILSSLTSTISENATSLISNGLDIALTLSERIRDGAGKLVDAGIQLVMSIAQGIADSLPTIVEKLPEIVTNIAGVINDNAPKLLETGMRIIVTLVQGLIQAIPTILANLPQILMAIWNAFTAFNWIALGQQLITAITNGIVSLGESLPGALRNVGQRAWEGLKNINWSGLGSTIINFIKNGITALASLPGQALKQAGSLAMRAFTSIAWGNVGRDVVRGIVRGVTAAASLLLNALKGLAKRALNAAKSALGIGSPSKLFRDEVGKNIDLGMAVGIERSTPKVEDALDTLNSKLSLSEPIITPKVDTSGIVQVTNGLGLGVGVNGVGSEQRRGGVFNYTFNVYGTPNQSPREIAEAVRQIIITEENRKRMAWV